MSYFNEKEVHKILALAAMKETVHRERNMNQEDIKFSRASLEEIASESGISMPALDEAIAEVDVDEPKIEIQNSGSGITNLMFGRFKVIGLATLVLLSSFFVAWPAVLCDQYENLADQVEPHIADAADAVTLETATTEINKALRVLNQNPIVKKSLSKNSAGQSIEFAWLPEDDDIGRLYQTIFETHRQLNMLDGGASKADRDNLSQKLDELAGYYHPEALLNSQIYKNSNMTINIFSFISGGIIFGIFIFLCCQILFTY